MSDKENCRRVTRASKKRAAGQVLGSSSSHEQNVPAAKKNRTVLGDISSNVLGNQNENLAGGERPAKKAKKGSAAAAVSKKTPGEDAVGFTVACTKTGIDVRGEDDDPQMCAAYASGIYEYLRGMEKESKRRPLPDYIEKVQNDISANMRGILVDWLVEVTDEYKLEADSLFLAVSHIDRYLSVNVINRQRLQLLGVSAMLVATKYEEINPPQIHEFVYITDNTYTKQEVVKMESDVLNSLKFEMGNPTVKTFLRRLTRFVQDTHGSLDNFKFEFLGYYLAELSLLDYGCIKFLPSMVAASVIFIARFTLDPKTHPWDLALQQYSGYKASDLKQCVSILHDLQLRRKGGSLEAIRDKYKQHKFKFVSTLTSLDVIPASYFEDVESFGHTETKLS